MTQKEDSNDGSQHIHVLKQQSGQLSLNYPIYPFLSAVLCSSNVIAGNNLLSFLLALSGQL